MSSTRLFISSVQKEFSAERAVLREFLRGNALMKRFFDVFLLPSSLTLACLRGAHGSVPHGPSLPRVRIELT